MNRLSAMQRGCQSSASCSSRSQSPAPAMCARRSSRCSRSRSHLLSPPARTLCVTPLQCSRRTPDNMELETMLERYREKSAGSNERLGDVCLVGTGPGDPGLLTLRAVQMMQSADVVLYDRLVSDDILRLVNPGAVMVYVGKSSGYHTRRQEEIHELLYTFTEAGARVLRLKGGDPYVFGRGGEEVNYLKARGVKVNCVPGITAAAGICAELGIPMTHRGVATSVRYLTGHSREGGEEQLENTMAVVGDPNTTLIVYMGLQTLPSLYAQLRLNGLPADTPAVAVERGTMPDQRIVYASLEELPDRVVNASLRSPTLLIIGQVVALSPGWQDWLDTGKPLLYEGSTWGSADLAMPGDRDVLELAEVADRCHQLMAQQKVDQSSNT